MKPVGILTAATLTTALIASPAAPLAAASPGSDAHTSAHAAKSKKGVVRIKVRGLGNKAATIRLKGSRRTVVVAVRRDRKLRLRSGLYRVDARAVSVNGKRYVSRERTQRVRVSPGSAVAVKVTYRRSGSRPRQSPLGSTGIDSGSEYQIIGPWVIGQLDQYETTLRGYNHRTGREWTADPTAGVSGLPDGDDLWFGRYKGHLVVTYGATIHRGPLQEDAYTTKVITVNPATGRRVATCDLGEEDSVASAGDFWLRYDGSRFDQPNTRRFDPLTCRALWPAYSRPMFPQLDAGDVAVVELDNDYGSGWGDWTGRIAGIDVATGAVRWTYEPRLGEPKPVGRYAGTVVFEDGIVTFRDPATWRSVGGTIGVLDVFGAQVTLDESDGTVYHLKDGTLSAWSAMGTRRLWALDHVGEVNFDLELACYGRLWVNDVMTLYLLGRNGGGAAREVERRPYSCLSPTTGLFVADRAFEVARLPTP